MNKQNLKNFTVLGLYMMTLFACGEAAHIIKISLVSAAG